MASVKRVYHRLRRDRRFRAGGYTPRVDRALARRAVRFGSDYGGWALLADRLDGGSNVYSAGLGQDVSFDLSVIDRVGCNVQGFDPTPVSLAYLRDQQLPTQMNIHACGLAGEDGVLRLHAPSVEGHASYTEHHAGGDERGGVEVPVKRVATLMRELGHDRLDVLKMDIEGSEYGVIDDLVAGWGTGGPRPRQLLVEFHHRVLAMGLDRTRAAHELLEELGYRLFAVSAAGDEFSYVLNDDEHPAG